MLSIKQLYKKIFSHTNDIKPSENDDNFKDDIIILKFGLTPKYEIDISLEIKELLVKDNEDLTLKADKIGSFFYTIASGGLNNTVIDFLMKEMSDEQNKKLFESIVYSWLLLEQNHKHTTTKKQVSLDPVVPPSKAFIQYLQK